MRHIIAGTHHLSYFMRNLIPAELYIKPSLGSASSYDTRRYWTLTARS